ncbi:MAG TPA: hypothetical protein VEJ89_01225 [Myxococcaceae bacterium]|nr:hypothetical protein [Myxococcaceae bacterium]
MDYMPFEGRAKVPGNETHRSALTVVLGTVVLLGASVLARPVTAGDHGRLGEARPAVSASAVADGENGDADPGPGVGEAQLAILPEAR